jgi:hypothetical protein
MSMLAQAGVWSGRTVTVTLRARRASTSFS